ncbi:4-hydroxybenzoate octaprenyltransferase [Allosphingosinicella deserti]|uniref:4-hydroxybenzoate octaprenyltransferase n=1 Tax=Allosphingosinicella deserti TaxID=2116704 RepID=A0A2P7QYV9_9SPHN|nr:4-hydroxybenzoate octaprenyltransferase [Sphingomonas deserti]PSJ43146.1 4-hydroxybenzoate octaprenyltransferase [Sphingomonas deserti]
MATGESDIVPDSEQRGLIGALPAGVRPYASLMRLDRPIGAWLLFWPGAWSVALAGLGPRGFPLILWLALGAWAMRSAGCVYNDIVDKDLDRKVERTRLRPLASGRATVTGAWVLLVALSLIGLVVLLQLDRTAQIIALGSLAPVAAYPFMKRITWWPQAWLGLVFSWAALVGWPAVTGEISLTPILLYCGSICWVIGYDTIYALQDREDDALVGVRSSALALGPHARLGVTLFYLAALLFWAVALWRERPDGLSLIALLPMAAHLLHQTATLKPADGDDALHKFRSNRFAGLLMFLACVVVGTS